MMRKKLSQPAAQVTDSAVHGARLAIKLDAIAANYRKIAALAAPAQAAAVVKADAYGLGLAPVALRLAGAGCGTFFVAHYAEGMALRALLPQARIYILHGLPENMAERYLASRLQPVLNTVDEIAIWGRANTGRASGAILNFDTGMSRLGMGRTDAARLAADPSLLAGVKIDYLMSHLSCADQPDHPLNAHQLAAFNQIRALFPGFPATLANTAGALLGPQYCFDLIRPGIGLYGGGPEFGGKPVFENVVELTARILQVREVDSSDHVGYGATYRPKGPARIAVAGIGYADGFMRALGNSGAGAIGEYKVPCVGVVSMDLSTFDVTHVPGGLCRPGREIELIGPNAPLSRAAAAAHTIDYELLTRLGERFTRSYTGEGGSRT